MIGSMESTDLKSGLTSAENVMKSATGLSVASLREQALPP